MGNNVLFSKAPNPYTSSRQLVGGDDINNIVAQLNSAKDGISAGVGGTQALATQLGAAVNNVATVASANDSVKLPKGFPGLEVWIANEDADSLQVFLYGTSTGTIDGTDGSATGVAQAQGAKVYKCLKVSTAGVETWVSK